MEGGAAVGARVLCMCVVFPIFALELLDAAVVLLRIISYGEASLESALKCLSVKLPSRQR